MKSVFRINKSFSECKFSLTNHEGGVRGTMDIFIRLMGRIMMALGLADARGYLPRCSGCQDFSGRRFLGAHDIFLGWSG